MSKEVFSRNARYVTSSTKLYHATTAAGITEFRLGVNTTGETDEPINGIWFGTSYNGAVWHALGVAGRRRNAPSFIYECYLSKDAVIVDTKRSRMPTKAFARLVSKHMPWYLRLAYFASTWSRRKFVPISQWYRYVAAAASQRQQLDTKLSRHNAIIEVCRNIGIDVLVHPSTTLYGDGLAHWDEPVYGETVLLLNCQLCRPFVQYRA